MLWNMNMQDLGFTESSGRRHGNTFAKGEQTNPTLLLSPCEWGILGDFQTKETNLLESYFLSWAENVAFKNSKHLHHLFYFQEHR